MQDIEIARTAKLKNIVDITNKLNIKDEYVEQYGKYKAKINYSIFNQFKNKENGKLILVTAINPTPLGEGKTTVSIGLADAFSQINENVILALREPSMGPVFGIKGGATGGGYSQIAPMEEINLHFTGDIHAITSANNLLSAMIDNHIYFGNKLKFKEVTWKRCLDVNDRQLRCVNTGLSNEKNIVPREDGFDISVASEIMAVFCLSTSIDDLKERLGKIVIGYNEEEKPILARDLKAEGAMTVLLKDAFNPNIVQTLENTPAIVHGGPFANIAHGCNSIIATNIALKLADYVVTEAGFGADLGAEKFLNIKTRYLPKPPDVVVCVATIKALKYHGGMNIEEVCNKSIEYLENGYQNLLKHIQNLKNKFGLNVIVAINKYLHDTEEEIAYLKEKLEKENVMISLVESWEKGGKGAIDLAQKIKILSKEKNNFKYIYQLQDSIEEKIEKVAKTIYGAENVIFSDEVLNKIRKIEKDGYKELPVCIAKTQYSFSDDAKNLKCDKPFSITVKDIKLKAGAGFVVVICGNIFTMPGLPKNPVAEKINIDINENIIGIF